MKNIIVYMICFCIFAAWLFYEQRKSQKMDDKASEDFWSREQRANSTRNKDISQLPLLQADVSEIPDAGSDDESVIYYIGLLRENIKQPMIDLSSYSNTDLKLAYGVGNFKTLCGYDENYHAFLQNLTNLALAYSQAGLYEPAAESFRLALRFGSQKVSDYTGLAKAYLSLDEPEKVSALIRETESGDYPRKSSIVTALREVLSTYR